MFWEDFISELLIHINFDTKEIKKIMEKLLVILSRQKQFKSIGLLIDKNLFDFEAIFIEEGNIFCEAPKEGLKAVLLNYLCNQELFFENNKNNSIFKINNLSNLFIMPIEFFDRNYGTLWFEKDKEACTFFVDEIENIYKISLIIGWLFHTLSCNNFEKADYFVNVAQENFSNYEGLIFKSSIMQELLNKVIHLSKYDIPILITGETGTGKEEIAKVIHKFSKFKDGPFVIVNCGAIPESLFESELFGHRKGAFTTAIFDKLGLIKEADGGTIFFDEIGDVSLPNQVKMLRLIENKEFRPIGENKLEKVNVRFLFATNKNLEKMIKKGKFREDLFFRISAAHIHLPPLRDRKEDKFLIFEYFITKFSKEMKINKPVIKKSLIEFIQKYSWVGNIREMANLAKELLLWHRHPDFIDVNDLPLRYINHSNNNNVIPFNISLQEAKNRFTKDYVLKIMKQCEFNKAKACKILKISRWGLIKLLRRLEIA